MANSAGTCLGRYEIRSPLGAGGMGEVYLAWDTRLGRAVALKLLPAHFTGDEDRLRRFEQEACAASALNHPNILTIYEIGWVDDAAPFIATEFIEGVTLRQHISSARIGLAEALEIAIQVASALAAAHAAGIVHRDIKPENVMLRPDGYIKVLDFGMATLVERRAPTTDTEALPGAPVDAHRGALTGTAQYMSPEQARGLEVDTRSDIWSLGVVLFELVTGRRPFEGESRPEVLRAILSDESPVLGAFRSDVPLELESIIRRALEKNRDERYRSADELASDLRSLRGRLESVAAREEALSSEAVIAKSSAESASDSAQPAPEEPPRRAWTLARRYRRWFLWVGVLAALAALFDSLLLQPPGDAGAIRDLGLLVLAGVSLTAYVALRRRHAVRPVRAMPKGVAFRGLLPFQEADRDRFYGREMDTLALFEMITHNLFRFGVLFGDSGCGKTSLVRAGLVPKLWEEGHVPIYCRSYKDPQAALLEECRRRSQIKLHEDESSADYLGRVCEELGAPLVIICDQFEEFFVNFRTKPEREPFVSLVATCHATTGLQVKFLFSMRSDFLYLINAEFAGRIPEPLLSSKLYHLRNFDEDEARGVIEKSARRANLPFEVGLSRHVARDLTTDNVVSPSELQIVGERLQSKRIFTVQEYRRAGGKEQLVHSFLEDVIQASGDREGAQLLLRSLISDENTRLTLPLEEIAKRTQRNEEMVRRLLDLFTGARLLREIQDEEPWRYELMHEYLIEKINQVTGKVMDATQRANRLLRQYLSNYSVDRHTRIPIAKLWFIKRYADREQGARGRELLRKSLRWGIAKTSALVWLLAVVTTVAAAALSMSEEWEGVRLSDGHTAAARQVAISPDGRLMVTVGEDGKVIVWDFARRERRAVFSDHTGPVNAVAFSPDGKWFASGGDDRNVIVWDAAQLRVAAVLRDHDAKIVAVAFSPDGHVLASMATTNPGMPGADAGRTILWEVGQWRKIHQLPPFGPSYGNIQFSPDSRLIVFQNGEAWDVVTGKPAGSLFGDEGSGNWFALSSDIRHLVAISTRGEVNFSDLSPWRLRSRHDAHQDHGRAIVFSPEGRLVASAAENIVLWDAATREKIARLEHTSIVWNLAFSPDGRWLVSTHGDGSILLWDVAERERIANFNEHSGAVRAVAFSPDGRRVASASEDRSIIIWDAEGGQKQAVLGGHDTRVTAVAFSHDDQWLASADQGGTTKLWNLARREPSWAYKYLYEGRGETSNYCVAVSPDGRWVATSAGVYESATGHQVIDFHKTSSTQVCGPPIYGVAFSADGRRLISISAGNGCILVRDTEKWEAIAHVVADELTLVSVSLARDGKQLVTGDDEGTVRLWEVGPPLREVALLGRHGARVKSVAFSPDGQQVASAGDDKIIALWDVGQRSLITYVGAHAAPVLAVAFSPDGRRIVSGEHDHSVRLYTRHRTLWGYRLD